MRTMIRGVQLARGLFLPALLAILSQATVAAQPQTADACAGPTTDVLVMALQDPTNERAHLILIKNNSNDPVTAFSIGDGIKPELYASPFSVPEKILGPIGWTATHVFKEESMFMHWIWTAKKSENMIAPGDIACDFKIVLPPFPASAQKNRYPDGTVVQPITVSELPFHVVFGNGRCAWGQIRPLVIGSSAKTRKFLVKKELFERRHYVP